MDNNFFAAGSLNKFGILEDFFKPHLSNLIKIPLYSNRGQINQ